MAGRPRFPLPPNFRWQPLWVSQKQAVWLWHRLRLPVPVELLIGSLPTLYHSPDFTLPRLLRARAIVTVHDLSFEVLSDVHEPRLRQYLQRAVPDSIRRANHVFADSESTREAILSYYGSDPAKVSVVYPGIEPRFRPYDETNALDHAALAQARERLGLTRPFVLNVGTVEPRKNLGTLIEAMARYRSGAERDVMLVLAGGGGWLGERERLEALVAKLGLEAHVRFLGFVEDALLPALINLAEALAYPSRYEGFGLPVLEALACGTPVITARNSSLPEAGGAAARYIEEANDAAALAEALGEVLGDAATRAAMIRAGIEHARQFSWASTAQRVLGLYQQVIDAS